MKLDYHQLEEDTFNFLYKKHLQDNSFNFSTRRKFIQTAKQDYFIGTENSGYFAFSIWNIPVWYPGASIDLLDFVIVTNRENPYFHFQFYMSKNVSESQNILSLNFFNILKNELPVYHDNQYLESDKKKQINIIPLRTEISNFYISLNDFINEIIIKVDDAINIYKTNHRRWEASRISIEQFENNLSILKSKLGLKFTSNFDELLLSQEVKAENNIITNPSLETTEKESLTKSRIGQGIFRYNLISLWGHCAISNITNTDLIRASHIKPWRISNNEERLDCYNGLPLLPNYDLLFDKFLISFTDSGNILISHKLSLHELEILNLDQNIVIEIKEQNKKYLAYHREQFYINNI